MNDIGRCITCHQPNCPTPTIKDRGDGNCSWWTNGESIPQINEHEECPKCDSIMTVYQGHYPLRCEYCEGEK